MKRKCTSIDTDRDRNAANNTQENGRTATERVISVREQSLYKKDPEPTLTLKEKMRKISGKRFVVFLIDKI